MRKLETKQVIEKKQKKNQIILGTILIFLLVVSTAGYSIMNSQSQKNSFVEENGIRFYSSNGLWIIELGEVQFTFQNLPSEISDIQVEINSTLADYYDSAIYLQGVPRGASEILANINNFILRSQEACTNKESCSGDLPVKTCDDNVFIFIENSNETKVGQDKNCIYIYGDSIRGADAFLYKILGIT